MSSSIKKFGPGLGDPNASSEVWGGKGAGLMRMAAEGLPVPPGFTITTEACGIYQKHPEVLMDAIMAEVPEYLTWLEQQFGYMPLLSVRSGARVSMPGMMDTILNVGINRDNLEEWQDRLGTVAGLDCYRRLLMMLGDTALGIPKDEFALSDEVELEEAIAHYETLYSNHGHDLPGALEGQLRCAIEAVFRSWQSPRAVEYRKLENIPDDWGTSVTVQAMVFGNMNDKSCSGVLFSRNPSTGEKGLYGEFLKNAQGEDVVAGTHTPIPVQKMKDMGWVMIYDALQAIASKLETTRRDMQDMEFTVQNGELFMLQTRNGKRSAQAAFRVALDMVDEGLITMDEAIARVKPSQFKVVKRPQIDPKFKDKPMMTGIAGSVGIATGRVALSAKEAVALAQTGEKVILVTHETTPDDIAGMAASVGILTQTGGATSHAAVVARGMDKPCVVGCTDLTFNPCQFGTGDLISIDGATGRVWAGEVPVIEALDGGPVQAFLDRMFEHRGLIEKTTAPKAGACVALGDWLGLSDKQIGAHCHALFELLKAGHSVTLDASFEGDSTDNLIWGIAGASPEAAMMDAIVATLAKGDLTGSFVMGDDKYTKVLKAAGAQDIPTVSTIEELHDAKGMVRLSWQLAQTIGGHTMQTKVFAALRETGLMTAKIMSEPKTRGYAAFTMLGAA